MRRIILAAASLALGAGIAYATAGHGAAVYAIDGDTIVVGIERVRIMGVDTPEIHGQCAAEIAAARRARLFTVAAVADGVVIERHGVDRYGRTLAVVRIAGGRDLAAELIAAGLGRPYHGERRRPWC